MSLFGRRKQHTVDVDSAAAQKYLEDFIYGRPGVEIFAEPATVLNLDSVLAVDQDGASARVNIPNRKWGIKFARRHKLNWYDAGQVGYPQRFREWNRRQGANEKSTRRR